MWGHYVMLRNFVASIFREPARPLEIFLACVAVQRGLWMLAEGDIFYKTAPATYSLVDVLPARLIGAVFLIAGAYQITANGYPKTRCRASLAAAVLWGAFGFACLHGSPLSTHWGRMLLFAVFQVAIWYYIRKVLPATGARRVTDQPMLKDEQGGTRGLHAYAAL